MPVSIERSPPGTAPRTTYPLATTIFRPKSQSDVKASVVFANATGVQGRFYHNVAEWLATNGVASLHLRLPLLGASFPLECDPVKLAEDEDYFEEALRQCPEHVDLTTTWCKVDLASMVRLAYESNPQADVTMIGHSLGGHLMAVLPSDHVYGPKAKVKRLLKRVRRKRFRGEPERTRCSQVRLHGDRRQAARRGEDLQSGQLGLGYDLPYGPEWNGLQWYFHTHFAFNRPENMKLARGIKGIPLLYVGFEDDEKITK